MREFFKLWFDAARNFLIGVKFCYWNWQKSRAEYYKGKHLRVLNSDESEFPLSAEKRTEVGQLVLIDPTLPRPGTPTTKVSWLTFVDMLGFLNNNSK